MEFFKKLDPKHQKALKVAGGVLVVVLVFAALLNVIKPSPYGPMAYGRGGGDTMSIAPSAMPQYDMAYEESMSGNYAGKGVSLSTRNIMPVPPSYGGTTGSDAEAFEVTDYNASIETSDLAETCGTIASWKSKDYVIFENSNTGERSCNHTFKVKKANVPEILAAVRDLDPRDLNENVYTIKEQVKDYTSQETILKNKLTTIDQTLRSALTAYDEITSIATRGNDASSLAKIIDSKLQMIERLTQEKLNITTQLDYLTRAKADELDKLDYTRFYVSVYENKYVDVTNIKDSWKQAVRDFVYNVNSIIQDVSIGLIEFIFVLAQFLLYVAIILVVAKYGWRFVKSFWTK